MKDESKKLVNSLEDLEKVIAMMKDHRLNYLEVEGIRIAAAPGQPVPENFQPEVTEAEGNEDKEKLTEDDVMFWSAS